ncbi:hypothetical protein C7441_101485 [Pseudaminobacter salicylatoxidans]|uniref:Uncharacterized protein n=1 Tax=Pseudaminobacter salicylatoxidans TaxID=93369 RepID=A0A316CWZ5_PSESE|nr:hypothetical protein [Pseudaminobacter salicylatoxidans]PWJ86604.1 hypothetical protein C7441_101485 [Pseudaminobacter salicylatoxidans]
MPTTHQFLTSRDLEKIKRVLVNARSALSELRMEREAARFLMQRYLEGTTEEPALADALDNYLAKRHDWQFVNGSAKDKRAH